MLFSQHKKIIILVNFIWSWLAGLNYQCFKSIFNMPGYWVLNAVVLTRKYVPKILIANKEDVRDDPRIIKELHVRSLLY